jgi:hypothetical protein
MPREQRKTPPKKLARSPGKKLEEKTANQDQQPSAGLTVPLETPRENYEEVEGYLSELGGMAQETGVQSDELQDAVDFAMSLAVSDPSRIDYAGNPQASIASLERMLGREQAAQIISDARAAVSKLPRAFEDFLNSTGLGDDPSVLMAIACYGRGVFRQSAEDAQRELDEMKRDPRGPYRDANHSAHKSAVIRANLIYQRLAKAEKRAASSRNAEPSSSANAKKASLERELKAAIADKDYRHPGPNHAAAVSRVEGLYRALYPEDGE